MRVVVSHLKFAAFAGTETYTLTVAQQLEHLGHDTTIYAPETGGMAESAVRQGVRVVSSAAKLPRSCDAVFAQDAATAYELAGRYPSAVRTCTVHSAHNSMTTPPQLEHASHIVVVLNDRLARRAANLAFCPEVVRLRQPIDLKRFNLGAPVGEPRRRPRVLMLGNYDDLRIGMVEEAARRAGMEFNLLGAQNRVSAAPEHAIADAEIVVSAGRGALEGMAGGRAVYIFTVAGGDGWVTPSTYPSLESDGFSGRATRETIDVDRLTADLEAWKPGMGEPNRDLAWANHDAERHANDLLELVHRLDSSPPPVPQQLDEVARLVRLEWYSSARAETAMNENRHLRAEVEGLRNAVTATNHRLASVELDLDRTNHELELSRHRLDALVHTRRYRLASHIAGPLDRLRARWRG